MNSPMTIKAEPVVGSPEKSLRTDKQSVHLDHQGSSMKDLIGLHLKIF